MLKKLIPIALVVLLLSITAACGGGGGSTGKTLNPGKTALQQGTTFTVPAGGTTTVELHVPRYQRISAWRWHTTGSAGELEARIDDSKGNLRAQSGRTTSYEEEFKVPLEEGDYLIHFNNEFDSTNPKSVWLRVDWYGESLAR